LPKFCLLHAVYCMQGLACAQNCFTLFSNETFTFPEVRLFLCVYLSCMGTETDVFDITALVSAVKELKQKRNKTSPSDSGVAEALSPSSPPTFVDVDLDASLSRCVPSHTGGNSSNVPAEENSENISNIPESPPLSFLSSFFSFGKEKDLKDSSHSDSEVGGEVTEEEDLPFPGVKRHWTEDHHILLFPRREPDPAEDRTLQASHLRAVSSNHLHADSPLRTKFSRSSPCIPLQELIPSRVILREDKPKEQCPPLSLEGDDLPPGEEAPEQTSPPG